MPNSIVDQRFAFEDGDDAGRDAKRSGNGGRGDSVGSSNHGAQQEAGTEVERADKVVRKQRDAQHGKPHEADGQHGDGDEVAPEIAVVRLPRSGVKQGRKNDGEEEVGPQRDLWNMWDERDAKAREHEQDGIRYIDASRETCKERHHDQEEEQDDFERMRAAGREHVSRVSEDSLNQSAADLPEGDVQWRSQSFEG
jgi:hypothetical protein